MNDPASRQIRPARSLALLWGETARLDRLRQAGDLPGPVVVLAPAESLKTQAPEADLIPVEGVLSAEPGEAWLTGHSLPGLFSLKPASAALRQLFPGLRARREIAVPRIAPAALLPWFAPGAEGGAAEIALVLDTPGSEIEMLELLDGAGLLARVGTLHLRCTAETGFDGGADEAGIVRWLEDRLFACRARITEDADWPELVFAPTPGPAG